MSIQTAEGLGIKSVLIGALISELSPEIGADYPASAGTNDAGLRLACPGLGRVPRDPGRSDWQGLQAASQDRRHRLLRGEVMVDLIPYGENIAPAGRLRWPDSEFEMNVIGFKESAEAAGAKVKKGAPAVPIISIPGFVLGLRSLAFLDRPRAVRMPDTATMR